MSEEKKYTDKEVDETVEFQLREVAFILGELGFSKQHIKELFAARFTDEDEYINVWCLGYKPHEKFAFDYLYSQLPESPGEGQAVQVPTEELRPVGKLVEEIKTVADGKATLDSIESVDDIVW